MLVWRRRLCVAPLWPPRTRSVEDCALLGGQKVAPTLRIRRPRVTADSIIIQLRPPSSASGTQRARDTPRGRLLNLAAASSAATCCPLGAASSAADYRLSSAIDCPADYRLSWTTHCPPPKTLFRRLLAAHLGQSFNKINSFITRPFHCVAAPVGRLSPSGPRGRPSPSGRGRQSAGLHAAGRDFHATARGYLGAIEFAAAGRVGQVGASRCSTAHAGAPKGAQHNGPAAILSTVGQQQQQQQVSAEISSAQWGRAGNQIGPLDGASAAS